MLQPRYTYGENDCNNNLVSRYEEIVQQYEDPIRAMVHRTLEVYIEKAFEEFIGGNIGKYVNRARDGKKVKEYRNGYRYMKHCSIGMLPLTGIRIPRNRAGGFKPEILRHIREHIGKIAVLVSSLYINGLSTRKIRRSLERAGITLPGVSKSSVSRAVKQLVQEYIAWINRSISFHYDNLWWREITTVYST